MKRSIQLGFITAGVVASFAVVLKLGYMAVNDELGFLILRGANEGDLKSFSGKLEFASKYWLLGLIWMYIYVHIVMLKRVMTGALNPLDGKEHLVLAQTKIFTNSTEQFFLSVISQMVVMNYLKPYHILRIIPLCNVLFVIGRIFFCLGYPKFRTFGLTVGMLPASFSIYYATYMFYINNFTDSPATPIKV